MATRITSHKELIVYTKAFEAATRIYQLSKGFPKEEMYSLTDQIRRSSRSVCANLAEAWRKRRYKAAFLAKLSDSEAEAAETQVWLEFAIKFLILEEKVASELYQAYDEVLRMLVAIIDSPEKWVLK